MLVLAACLASHQPTDPHPMGPGTETGNPGVLRDAAGMPLAGVSIRVWAAPDTSLNSQGVPKAYRLYDSTVSDSSGRFRFQRPANRGAVLEAIAPPLDLGLTSPAVDSGTASVQDIRLIPLGNLQGTVTRGGPWPLEGVEADEGILVQLLEINRFLTTPDDGSFRFAQVPAGSYTLAAYALDGHFSPLFLGGVEVKGGKVDSLDTLTLAWSPQGQPPPVLDVVAEWDSAALTVQVSWRPLALTDLAGFVVGQWDGRETFLPLDTVPADIHAAALASSSFIRGSDSLKVAVRALDSAGNLGLLPIRPAVVSLPTTPVAGPSTWVSGQILDQSGIPARQARVLIHALPIGDTGRAYLADSARFLFAESCDSLGRFRIRVPALRVVLEGMTSSPSDGKALTAAFLATGDSLELGKIPLRPTGGISGTISRGGICVACQLKEDGFLLAWSLAGPYTAVTNSQGRFELSDLPIGKHSVVLYGTPEGWFQPKVLENIEVIAGQITDIGVDTLIYDSTKPPPAPSWTLARWDSLTHTVTLGWQARTQVSARLVRREGIPPVPVLAWQVAATQAEFQIKLDTLSPGTWFDFTLEGMNPQGAVSQRIVTPLWRR